MRTTARCLLALLSIALGATAFADSPFRPGPADQYPHQENNSIVIGAKLFSTQDATAPVFGKKVDFNKYDVLPVLVVIENGGKEALDLSSLEVKLVSSGGQSIVSLAPSEVPAIAVPARQPELEKRPLSRKPKNPLNVPEIEGRAFSARMLPPAANTSGFFYFRAQAESGMRLLVNGIVQRPSGKALLYFEIEF
jgi:hypothetical protein